MRLVYLLLAVFASANIAQAQTEVLSKIPVTGKTPESFYPNGFEEMPFNGRIDGDLNNDGAEDIAIALHSPALEKSADDAVRILLILMKTSEGYKLGGKSSEVLMCSGCGGIFGDPFASLDIKKGVLSVDHFGGSNWRWAVTEKFRYQNGSFCRIGTTHDSWWIFANCHDVGNGNRNFKDTNWITGQQEIIETDGNCKVIKNIKQKIKVSPLVKLEDYVYNDND